ncbi:MAG: hypothetical protein WC617_20365 [Rhodanobacter sp.]|jgi:hypothetical protein
MHASSLGFLGIAFFVVSVVLAIANRFIRNSEAKFLVRKIAEFLMAIAFGLISYALVMSTIEQYEVGRAAAASRGGAVAVFNKQDTPLMFISIMVFKIVGDAAFIAISAGWIAKFLGFKIKINF